jgi:P4 family phage/plasmid primase-like protien
MESKPMLNKTVKEYFPTFNPTITRKKKIQLEPLYVSISNELKDKYDFITMEDTDQIYIKRGNIYSPNLGNFKKDMAEAIAETGKTITHLSANIIKYVKYTTQFNRKEFCYDSWLINFHNGYYDCLTNKFFPNSKHKDKLFCYEIPHDYKKEKVDCPKFKKLLQDWLGEDSVVTPSDMFEMIGYSMTMNTDMKTAFFIFGPTNTGKTQFQTVLEHVVGHQNRGAVPLQRLEKNEFGSDGLEFKILNMGGDMSDISPKDTSTFKVMTGGDEWIGAEYKGGKKYEFRCILKIWYNGNMIPVLIKDDDAFYGRWVLIPFLVEFPKFDKNTVRKIGKELCKDDNEIQGIIHEAIKGLKRLQNRNYFRYEIIKNTKHTWRYEAEPLYAFIHDNCSYDEEDGIQCNKFKRKFNKFLYTRKLRPESSQTLKDKLEKFGVYKERHGSANDRDYYFMGFKWKSTSIDKEWEKKYFQ